jgi:tetratricopeptide (TPR) repeat protein
MPAPRAIVILACWSASLFLQCAAQVPPSHSDQPESPAANPPFTEKASNPYQARLQALTSELKQAPAPLAAALLDRIYGLREFVDDPAPIGRQLEQVAADPGQHPLVRDEALHYLALLDVSHNQLSAAEARLSRLGFVREWLAAGPIAAPQGLNTSLLPPLARETLPDSPDPAPAAALEWRRLPSFGPKEWIDLSRIYPASRANLLLLATSVYSAGEQAVALRLSTDCAFVVAVDGRTIFTHSDGGTGVGFDQHAVGAWLQPGWNRLLVKLAPGGNGPCRFALRITALPGGGLALPVSTEPPSLGPNGVMRDEVTLVTPKAPPVPADLVDMAQTAASSAPDGAPALETWGLLERQHARGTGSERLELAALRAPTAERWLAVAETCADSTCAFRALQAAVRSDDGDAGVPGKADVDLLGLEPATVTLAAYYSARHQLQKALDLLRQALRQDPEDFVARNDLIEVYLSAGLKGLALSESERLQRRFPNPLWLRTRLAERYLKLGLPERAAPLLAGVLASDYGHPQARVLLLQVAQARHNVDALRAAYEDMARLDPADPSPPACLAELAAGAGDEPAAERAMHAALEIASENAGLRERWANLLVRSGQEARARQQLDLAAQLDPQSVSARLRPRLQLPAEPREDAAYLADPAELAAEARREPPADGGNASLLADVRIERVYPSGASAVRQQQIFYLATEQGAREYGVRSVQFSPSLQQLQILHARLYKRDGRVLEANESGENEVADANVSMYYDVRARTLQFPGAEAGDVVELDYRLSPVSGANPYGDYFGGLVVFRSKLAKALQRYVLITPARRQFSIVAPRMSPAAVALHGQERIYRWEARNVPALTNEPRGPALTDIAPYVHVSTFQSWPELGRWYAQLIRPQFALDAALRGAADRLLADTHDERERISAIHQFVLRNTHYVALEFGIYSYKPYPVAQTYARRFGDCKDKASLMIALLRRAGIEADLALVRTRSLGGVDPHAASVAVFNHAIVYLPKYDLWLDGTAEYAGLNELPLDDQGASALVVAADGAATLRRIPLTEAGDNYTRRTVMAKVMKDGSIEFSGETYTRGEDAPGLRREYESPDGQRDAVRNSLVFPSVHLDDVQVQGAGDLEHAVTVNFRGTLDSFVGQTTLPLASSWLSRTYMQTLAGQEVRTQDLLLPAPWTADEELHFALPKGAKVVYLPGNTSVENAYGSLSLHYERHSSEIVVRTSVQFRKLRIPPEEYQAFRDFCFLAEHAFHEELKVRLPQ